jgi:hypothetical protein
MELQEEHAEEAGDAEQTPGFELDGDSEEGPGDEDAELYGYGEVAADEPPELTAEIHAATTQFRNKKSEYRNARQRLSQAQQARGHFAGGNKPSKSITGAARRPGETLAQVKARTTCKKCKQKGHWGDDPECPMNSKSANAVTVWSVDHQQDEQLEKKHLRDDRALTAALPTDEAGQPRGRWLTKEEKLAAGIGTQLAAERRQGPLRTYTTSEPRYRQERVEQRRTLVWDAGGEKIMDKTHYQEELAKNPKTLLNSICRDMGDTMLVIYRLSSAQGSGNKPPDSQEVNIPAASFFRGYTKGSDNKPPLPRQKHTRKHSVIKDELQHTVETFMGESSLPDSNVFQSSIEAYLDLLI